MINEDSILIILGTLIGALIEIKFRPVERLVKKLSRKKS